MRDTTKSGRLRLLLRSKKVVSGMVELDTARGASTQLMGLGGWDLPSRRRVVVYDYVFDEEQLRTLRGAQELAERSGLLLEVIDMTRVGVIRRALRLRPNVPGGNELARLLGQRASDPAELGAGALRRPRACLP